MKKVTLKLFMFFLYTNLCFSQDFITNDHADEIIRKIKKINKLKALERGCGQAYGIKPDCIDYIDSFCQKLYDPENPLGPGNIDLKIGDQVSSIRFGKNKLSVPYAYIALSQARLHNKESFPKNFKKHLDRFNYFKNLERRLNYSKIDSHQHKRKFDEIANELSYGWNKSFEYSVDDEMEKRHPGFLNLKNLPPRWKNERSEIENELDIAINKATWTNDASWKKVELDFKEVQNAFIDEIKENSDIPSEYKEKWINRIKTIELLIPGSKDFLLENGDGCFTDVNNAWYYPEYHAFTICVGAFTTDAMLRTISHELSHSIGEGRDEYVTMLESPLGQSVQNLRFEMCQKKSTLGCSPEWRKIKDNLRDSESMLDPIKNFTSTAPELRKCLQYSTTQTPGENFNKELTRIASGYVYRSVNMYAGEKYFLNLIKPTTFLNDGTEVENLDYFDPCYSEPFDPNKFSIGGNSLLLFYLAEYQCQSEKNPSRRMENAIHVAEEIQKIIYKTTIPMGGPFSPNYNMIANNYAENSEERFADWMASRVFSRVIENRKLNSISRLNELAFNTATFCEPPSNETLFEEEAQTQKIHNDEPHSLNIIRRKEILTKRLREAIGCTIENPTKECSL